MTKFKFFEGFIENTFVFEQTHIQIQGGVRRLRAVWTRETASNIRALHNIDAVSELTSILSERIAREIDQDIIRRLTTSINGGNVA
jgi:hypothetical protein